MKLRIQDYLFPLHVYGYHNRMKSAPYWLPDKLAERSMERRKAIVAHAYENVPYYRQLFDKLAIRAEKIDDPEVWRRIPRLNKSMLRSNSATLTAAGKYSKGAVSASTSDSTGMPLENLLDQGINSAAFALFWRAGSSGGYWRLGQRQAAMKRLYNEAGWHYNRIIRTLELSSVRVDRKNVHLYRDLMKRFKP